MYLREPLNCRASSADCCASSGARSLSLLSDGDCLNSRVTSLSSSESLCPQYALGKVAMNSAFDRDTQLREILTVIPSPKILGALCQTGPASPTKSQSAILENRATPHAPAGTGRTAPTVAARAQRAACRHSPAAICFPGRGLRRCSGHEHGVNNRARDLPAGRTSAHSAVSACVGITSGGPHGGAAQGGPGRPTSPCPRRAAPDWPCWNAAAPPLLQDVPQLRTGRPAAVVPQLGGGCLCPLLPGWVLMMPVHS